MRHAGTRPLVRRMQAIDQALRARKWPRDKTLAKDLEVDPRTIRRDLEFLRDEHRAPIAFDRARRGYHYTEPTYRLPLLQRPFPSHARYRKRYCPPRDDQDLAAVVAAWTTLSETIRAGIVEIVKAARR